MYDYIEVKEMADSKKTKAQIKKEQKALQVEQEKQANERDARGRLKPGTENAEGLIRQEDGTYAHADGWNDHDDNQDRMPQ